MSNRELDARLALLAVEARRFSRQAGAARSAMARDGGDPKTARQLDKSMTRLRGLCNQVKAMGAEAVVK